MNIWLGIILGPNIGHMAICNLVSNYNHSYYTYNSCNTTTSTTTTTTRKQHYEQQEQEQEQEEWSDKRNNNTNSSKNRSINMKKESNSKLEETERKYLLIFMLHIFKSKLSFSLPLPLGHLLWSQDICAPFWLGYSNLAVSTFVFIIFFEFDWSNYLIQIKLISISTLLSYLVIIILDLDFVKTFYGQ